MALSLCCLPCPAAGAPATPPRWSVARAQSWYAHEPWLVGANYLPASAINELEMWQPETFDPQRIDTEFGWAEAIGMNTMRVFLHDLLWQQDSAGFVRRIDTFLGIAARHHIRPLLVLFDSVWDPDPHLGAQHPPVPGVHNSGWVQSPSAQALADPAQYPRLEAYVKGVVGAFAQDARVLGWDLWNEPTIGPTSSSHWADAEAPHKEALVRALTVQAFGWARSAHPSQPLTSGVWTGPPFPRTALIQIRQSDVLSFHSYGGPEEMARRIAALERFNRPVLCTEYMARTVGSTFENSLPLLKSHRVAAINWGLVSGRSQTIYPWDSWEHPYTGQRALTTWFHDLFQPDGTPYREDEVDLIRALTGRGVNLKH
ncbi:MAG: 1,4-beta-xylanase [Gammaproteobacteria bacterium]|nr:1,4-beta-xylanase [Gammaproteobacteria bacterium]